METECGRLDFSGRPFYLTKEQTDWVYDTLQHMTLQEKAGQLFCLLGNAYELEERKELVGEKGIGAILFRPDKTEVVREQYQSLDDIAKIPLLKAANLEEGGAGVISDGTYFGSQMQVAAAADLSCTAQFARVCAAEGKRVGVNWTFSPVVDIDYNYRNPITNVRTFGSDPERVLANSSVFVKEIQSCGVAASCKHFPGDGVDYRDQHLHPTYNDLSAGEWFATYGRIYQQLIEEGLLSVMVGHIVQPNVIDAVNPDAPKLPASLSREMLTGVLRDRFHFQGVIITDATIMGGYTMAMPRWQAIPTTIQAGCDMICFSTDIYEDLSYVQRGLQEGILTPKRLDEAVLRILALKAKVAVPECSFRKAPDRVWAAGESDEKKRIGKEKEPATDRETGKKAANFARFMESDSIATPEECREWSIRCADQAITLVKDIQGLVPVDRNRYPKIRLAVVGEDAMIDGSLRSTAAEVLSENGFLVEQYDPFADDLHGSADLPADRLTLILANYPAASNQTTVRIFWCPKHALEIPRFVHEEATAFLSFANPYHLQDIPRVRTFINAYSASRTTVRLALEKLIGKSPFKGVSPVDAFCGLKDTRL